MEKGLDDLVEWLLTEIAFASLNGYSAVDLVKGVKRFYQDTVDAKDGDFQQSSSSSQIRGSKDQDFDEDDVAQASIVWAWLTARKDVRVGDDGKLNHLSLQEVLALPEAEDQDQAQNAPSANNDIAASKSTVEAAHTPRPNKKASMRCRPRLRLSEERQWKAVAGHGPDLKRLPLYEWKALLAIASVKEAGILQGDLVRLSKQDKRSLPMRTDALARKGYIVKQPCMLRGCRTSKIWLSHFAEAARQDESTREGLPMGEIDLSVEALTADWEPVPFSHYYLRGKPDYLALAQAFVAVVRAWKMMRYCDLRTKLGITELTFQMRSLAKSSRWLADIGVVEFGPGLHPKTGREYKDCVIYVRDPTVEEWVEFRSTPRAHLRAPSSRHRGELARARQKVAQAKASVSNEPEPQPAAVSKTGASLPNPDLIKLSAWSPYKPIFNTIFEIILRSGSSGSSHREVMDFTLGWPLRKWLSSATSMFPRPVKEPSYLQDFTVIIHLDRLGRTSTYRFWANGHAPKGNDGEHNGVSQDGSNESSDIVLEHRVLSTNHAKRPFHEPIPGKMFHGGSSAITKQFDFVVRPPAPLYPWAPGVLSVEALVQRPNLNEGDVSLAENHLAESIHGTKSIEEGEMQAEPPFVGSLEVPKNLKDIVLESPRAQSLPTGHSAGSTTPKKRGRGRPRREPAVADPKLVAEASPVVMPNGNDKPRGYPLSVYNHSKKHKVAIYTPPEELEIEESKKQYLEGKIGCFYGQPNSLGPQQRGRPKKSLVMVFRLPALKGPNLTDAKHGDNPGASMSLPDSTVPMEEDHGVQNQEQNASGAQEDEESNADDEPHNEPIEPDAAQVATLSSSTKERVPGGKAGKKSSKKGKRIIGKVYKCEKCGKSWKNDNGLDYHLKKSQSACNADYVPPPEKVTVRKKKPMKKTKPSLGLSDGLAKESADAEEKPELPALPSRRPRLTESTLQARSIVTVAERDTPRRAAMMETAFLSNSALLRHSVLHAPAQEANGESTQAKTTLSEPTILPAEHARSLDSSGDVSRMISAQEDTASPRVSLTDSILTPRSSERLPNNKPITSLDLGKRAFNTIAIAKNDRLASHGDNEQGSQINQVQQSKLGTSPASGSTKAMAKKRKNRTTDIVNELLHKNSGVFPGDQSLYRVITSVWSERFFDMSAPDWKYCKSIIDKMKDSHAIKHEHFGFFDAKGQPQFVSVICLAEATQEKVAEIKDKLKELWPNPYIPPLFRSSDVAAVSFEKTPSEHRETVSIEPEITGMGKKKSNVPVLSYEDMPVKSLKRPSSPTGLETGTSAKNPRFESDSEQSDTAITSPNTRKRRQSARKVKGQGQGSAALDFNWADHIIAGQLSKGTNLIRELDEWEFDVQSAMDAAQSLQIIDPIVAEKYEPSGANYARDEDEEDAEHDEEPDENSHGLTGTSSSEGLFADSQSADANIQFAPIRVIRSKGDMSWPNSFPYSFFADKYGGSFTMQGFFPSSQWLLRESIPKSAEEMVEFSRKKNRTIPDVIEIEDAVLRKIRGIEEWELSREGVYLQYKAAIAPEYIFITVTNHDAPPQSHHGSLEWHMDMQYGLHNFPSEFADVPSSSEIESDHSVRLVKRRKRHGPNKVRNLGATYLPRDRRGNYKTRVLGKIPKAFEGRWNKNRAVGDDLGLDGETELIIAFSIIKSLLGGVDRLIDWGLLVTLFPKMSHSGLRRFWSRVGRERKVFIDAFTRKFQTAFLEAYERGELAPLDYENTHSYDWKALIVWASRLETHESIEIPATKGRLYTTNVLEDRQDEADDWREHWYLFNSSTFSRVDAAAGDAVILAPPEFAINVDIALAKSWVRSLCNMHKVDASGYKIRDALMQLGRRDQDSLNLMLDQAVNMLVAEKIVSRGKGKGLDQRLKLNLNLQKRILKLAHTDKFVESVKFKTELDEKLRNGDHLRDEGVVLPRDADAGTIMAMFNMQASGRLVLQDEGFPIVPFGFEPSVYEGRTFPKSYYHFTLKLQPTDQYLFNDQMPVLEAAKNLEPPTHGPRGELPLWRDLWGKLDAMRWHQYLTGVTFTLATRGPCSAKSVCVLMKPMVEEFEVELIVDWLDRLGLIERAVGEYGLTVAEWWWLAIGHVVELNTSRTEKWVADRSSSRAVVNIA